jgi:HD-like signal output (HDOD) protein
MTITHTENRCPTPSLADVARRIQEISTLPRIALRVMDIASNPDAGPRELKEVMEADAALSMRVVRCVNSSAYAVRTKITSLQQAITYLGVKQIRNLALTASVSRLFEKDDGIGAYSRKGLWRHLVGVGICARLIAMRIRLPEFEDVFLAGLLHDIGIILEDQHVHAGFVDVLGALEQGKTLCDIEQAHLGFDHTRLGERVGRVWKLPDGVVDAIRYHHGLGPGYDGTQTGTVRCVELANFICSLRSVSAVGVHVVAFPRDTMLALALGKDDLAVLAEDFDRELNNNQTLFHL